MNFNYCLIEDFLDSINIEDIGNCTLQVNNDSCDEWYLNISTSLGWSKIQTFGPLKIGQDTIGYSFGYSYCEFEFSQSKLFKIIQKFLNEEKRNITQAQQIDEITFNTKLKSVRLKDDSD